MNKKLLLTLTGGLVLVVVLLLAVAFWVWLQLQPVAAGSTEQQRFVVAKGQSLIATANSLHEQGLIKQPQVFRYYSQFEKLDTSMQAGSYELTPSMSTPEIARALTQGTEDVWITLPEGWRREEVATYLASQELESFDEEEFLALTANKEGYLFPDTYLVPREATAQQLFNLLTGTFDQKITIGLAEELAASELSEQQVVTLASIVEREGRGETDMRHVSGILLNRMDIGMALETDATLQYIGGANAQGEWWAPPSVALKQMASPYNTYLYPGLPPAPIANPGLSAIKAVLDPIESDDIFYIHDTIGVPHYAKTLEEHNANVNKYLR